MGILTTMTKNTSSKRNAKVLVNMNTKSSLHQHDPGTCKLCDRAVCDHDRHDPCTYSLINGEQVRRSWDEKPEVFGRWEVKWPDKWMPWSIGNYYLNTKQDLHSHYALTPHRLYCTRCRWKQTSNIPPEGCLCPNCKRKTRIVCDSDSYCHVSDTLKTSS